MNDRLKETLAILIGPAAVVILAVPIVLFARCDRMAHKTREDACQRACEPARSAMLDDECLCATEDGYRRAYRLAGGYTD